MIENNLGLYWSIAISGWNRERGERETEARKRGSENWADRQANVLQVLEPFIWVHHVSGYFDPGCWCPGFEDYSRAGGPDLVGTRVIMSSFQLWHQFFVIMSLIIFHHFVYYLTPCHQFFVSKLLAIFCNQFFVCMSLSFHLFVIISSFPF